MRRYNDNELITLTENLAEAARLLIAPWGAYYILSDFLSKYAARQTAATVTLAVHNILKAVDFYNPENPNISAILSRSVQPKVMLSWNEAINPELLTQRARKRENQRLVALLRNPEVNTFIKEFDRYKNLKAFEEVYFKTAMRNIQSELTIQKAVETVTSSLSLPKTHWAENDSRVSKKEKLIQLMYSLPWCNFDQAQVVNLWSESVLNGTFNQNGVLHKRLLSIQTIIGKIPIARYLNLSIEEITRNDAIGIEMKANLSELHGVIQCDGEWLKRLYESEIVYLARLLSDQVMHTDNTATQSLFLKMRNTLAVLVKFLPALFHHFINNYPLNRIQKMSNFELALTIKKLVDDKSTGIIFTSNIENMLSSLLEIGDERALQITYNTCIAEQSTQNIENLPHLPLVQSLTKPMSIASDPSVKEDLDNIEKLVGPDVKEFSNILVTLSEVVSVFQKFMQTQESLPEEEIKKSQKGQIVAYDWMTKVYLESIASSSYSSGKFSGFFKAIGQKDNSSYSFYPTVPHVSVFKKVADTLLRFLQANEDSLLKEKLTALIQYLQKFDQSLTLHSTYSLGAAVEKSLKDALPKDWKTLALVSWVKNLSSTLKLWEDTFGPVLSVVLVDPYGEKLTIDRLLAAREYTLAAVDCVYPVPNVPQQSSVPPAYSTHPTAADIGAPPAYASIFGSSAGSSSANFQPGHSGH